MASFNELHHSSFRGAKVRAPSSDYYTFLDFGLARPAGGASALINNVKAFAAAGISNRLVAILDNDTAARDAHRAIHQVKLPPNIVVLHHPIYPALRDYPTLGPTGLAKLDVNGLAASIELYLPRDCLTDRNGELHPVHWRGFNEALGAYQGEVAKKDEIQSAFFQKVEATSSDPSKLVPSDWEGMHLILQAIFRSFEEIVPPPSRNSFWPF